MEENCSLVNCHSKTVPSKEFTLRWSVEDISQVINGNMETEFSFHFDDGCCKLSNKNSTLNFEVHLKYAFYCKTTFCSTANNVVDKVVGQSTNSKDVDENFCFVTNVSVKEVDKLLCDVLVILCTVSKLERYTVVYHPDPYDYLKSLESLLVNNPFPLQNVVLYYKSDMALVNKSVLFANSPVLEAIAKSKKDTGGTVEIELDHCDGPVIEDMVVFLNSGIIRCKDFESLCSLYCTATKYRILQLQDACNKLIVFYMSVETVSRILVLSERHQDDWLKKEALKFFKAHSRNVFATEQWLILMRDYTKLGIELIKFGREE